jgi:hypothetical protein
VLHRIIIEQVASMMVLPNKLPISLSEDVPAQVLRTPEPEVSDSCTLLQMTLFFHIYL